MPHIIIREWMPHLKDVELRVLLVITDQTLGWVEDVTTGRRKEKDWISRGQLMRKTGRGHSSVSVAVEKLVANAIIEAFDGDGNLLKSPKERSGNKIFYRLNLNPAQSSLFPVDKRVQKMDRLPQPIQNLDVQKVVSTKETDYTKLAKAAKLPTNDLLREFNRLTIEIRSTKPVFVRFKDGNLIKNALKHLSEWQIRTLFVWFLKEKRDMQPTVGAALSSAVIESFLKASGKEYGFYNRVGNLYPVVRAEQDENKHHQIEELRNNLSEKLKIK